MSDADRYEQTHGSRDFHVEHYDLDLTYRVSANRLSGTATLQVTVLEEVKEIALDLVGLAVDKLSLSGARLAKYRHRDGRLVLRLAEKVPAGARCTVTVRYSGNPGPVDSAWGPVGWEELDEGALVASQPVGAPSWFPCNDRPADKATYRTSLTVDSPYHVLAHGTLVDRRVRAATTTWVYEERHPTCTYLATVQIGHYSESILASGPVPQRVVAGPRHSQAATVWLERQPEMMSLFTELFGPYPFDAYTLVVTDDDLEIPLEAQGVSIFGSNHLDEADAARLVPHELAHQWFGNSLSVASWQHIWLNEGFACYAEWIWSEAAGGPTADSLARRFWTRLHKLDQDLLLADPGPDDLFDDRIYKRGALTLHALRTTMGDAAFFDLVRDWVARNRDGVVTTEAFRSLVAQHAVALGGLKAAVRVAALLLAWLDEEELPTLPAR
jgi:aminopeptidase N